MSNDTAAFLSDGLTFFLFLKLDTLNIDITHIFGDMQQYEIILHSGLDGSNNVFPSGVESKRNIYTATPISKTATHTTRLRAFDCHGHLVCLAGLEDDVIHGNELYFPTIRLRSGYLEAVSSIKVNRVTVCGFVCRPTNTLCSTEILIGYLFHNVDIAICEFWCRFVSQKF